MNLQMIKLYSFVVILICFGFSQSIAGDYKPAKTLLPGKDFGLSSEWKAVAYTDDSGKKYPVLPVKLCFFKNNSELPCQCEIFKYSEIFLELKVVKIREKEETRRGVLLVTNTYAMGGGPSFLSLWIYDNDKKAFRNALPSDTYVRALGSYRFFSSLQGKGVLVVAHPSRLIDPDGDLDDPDYEGIWSPHYYVILIYVYNQKRGFVMVKSFETKKKYDPEKDDPIENELKKIKMCLR